ncbi:WUSCHEL-related homeobox 9-like [Malania oleifera]|uniref:WUSCHEL-related homeobox 9-like n=1 Tax=Malania oleifera TaxID=397392 RepID=UPI0025AE7A6B|nr:WUSCHEL-related homeobox 9-like [Malania oleifera]
MASSNRHWPSMFKSKPCNTHPHQWQHDLNSPSPLLPTGCHTTPYTSGCEERSVEPKPRWNPRPEQIRILEAIFNSGMVNPPRDEIKKIRTQLQEYGQVGDANVFYWFQNRKSRSKHKQRHVPNSSKPQVPSPPSITTTSAASSSSSTSSDKSPPKSSAQKVQCSSNAVANVSNSPTGLANHGLLKEPFLSPMQQQQQMGGANSVFGPPGLCFSDHEITHYTELLLGEMTSQYRDLKREGEKMKEQLNYTASSTDPHSLLLTAATPTTVTVASTSVHQAQGGGVSPAPAKSTVFINDVAFEVSAGPFNVSGAFGDGALLVHSSGQPVLTNELGFTLHPLQHGAFYYLLRTLTPLCERHEYANEAAADTVLQQFPF